MYSGEQKFKRTTLNIRFLFRNEIRGDFCTNVVWDIEVLMEPIRVGHMPV
jgi:hypothetical protein